jgi:gamma-glutamylcyclotransferase (GGCT)/AIG2-like uncharacterized protein YtfP
MRAWGVKAKVAILKLLSLAAALLSGRVPLRSGYTRMFVYGSLKPGFYNYERRYYPDDANAPVRFSDVSEIVQEDRVRGLTLVTLGGYPGAIAAKETDEITGVIIDVPNGMAGSIDRMETGAGYEGMPFVTQGGYAVTVYVFQNQYGRKLEKIGDTWTLDHQNRRTVTQAWRGQGA